MPSVSELMLSSGVAFGTSGARGLVSAMTDEICFSYTVAFLDYLESSGQIGSRQVAIGADLRPSSGRIAAACAAAVRHRGGGYTVINCGEISSPALALFGMSRGIPTIMVTGSHIPDDRNGIKFTTPAGEITKRDEQGIAACAPVIPEGLFSSAGSFIHPEEIEPVSRTAAEEYLVRYQDFFGADFLQDMTIGVYQHSAVLRDDLATLITSLGAKTVVLGRSENFIPVDTEAIRPEDCALAKKWAQEHKLDAIVSADGDSDRPLISDQTGIWLRGDVAGILCARYLGVTAVATPVSSNTALEKCGWFAQVSRTRIGSPYVIAGMSELLSTGSTVVAGYEANGGFLLASDIMREGRCLKALPTRDAVILHLAILGFARQQGCSVAELLHLLPRRVTHSDRIKDFATARSQALIEKLRNGGTQEIEALLADLCGSVSAIDNTDGLRITFESGEIVHFRPSGNAPEMRCYTEADTLERAHELNQRALARAREMAKG